MSRAFLTVLVPVAGHALSEIAEHLDMTKGTVVVRSSTEVIVPLDEKLDPLSDEARGCHQLNIFNVFLMLNCVL